MKLYCCVVVGLVVACLGAVAVQGNVAYRGVQNRIISGVPAATGQFPWQVILRSDELDELRCGASIISNSWVLTAAHCTYGYSSMLLTFGSTELENSSALSMTSTQLFEHPNYNAKTLNNDVSLIKLPTPLTFSDTIAPIPLVTSAQSSNTFLGTVGTIAGFGIIDDEYLDFSSHLLFAQVQIIDNSQCVTFYGAEVVIDSTMCGKGVDGTNMSICSGDSGGPLIARDATGNYIQIGINSFVARDQCTLGFPSGFVRLTSFLDFITQTTGINYG